MKTALALSGGGSKGAFQAGALDYLLKTGFTFDVVSGVSVGSLNGVMMAQGKHQDMMEVWKTITEADVQHVNPWYTIAWNLLFKHKRSINDLAPLRETLRKHVKIEEMKVPFYMGMTSLQDGQYHSLKATDFADTEGLISGVYASACMPILWEPTDVKTSTQVIKDAVDGGVKNVVPLEDLLSEDADRIVIIGCSTGETPPVDSIKTVINVAERTFLDMMIDQIVHKDTSGILFANHLVKQAEAAGLTLYHPSGRPLKYFEVIFIKPPYNIGSSTDFSRENLDKLYALGYETAKKLIEGA